MQGNFQSRQNSFSSLSLANGFINESEEPASGNRLSPKIRKNLVSGCLARLSPLRFDTRLGSPRSVQRRKQRIREIMETDFEENLFHVKNLTAKKCVKFFGTSKLPPQTFPGEGGQQLKDLCAGCLYPISAHEEAVNQVNIKPWTRDTLKWRG